MARNIAQKLHGNSDEQPSTVTLRVLWLLLVCVASIFSAGYPSTLSYQPNEGIVDTLGVPQAQQLLKDTLLRSVNPRVDDVEVTDDFMRYHLAGTTYDVRIFFKDVQRAEVYKNNVVLIWGGDQRLLARPLLANTQEATTCADLCYPSPDAPVVARVKRTAHGFEETLYVGNWTGGKRCQNYCQTGVCGVPIGTLAAGMRCQRFECWLLDSRAVSTA